MPNLYEQMLSMPLVSERSARMIINVIDAPVGADAVNTESHAALSQSYEWMREMFETVVLPDCPDWCVTWILDAIYHHVDDAFAMWGHDIGGEG